MSQTVYVLRWHGFEQVLSPDRPYHEKRIEMVLGEHIVDEVIGGSDVPRFLAFWVFEFVEVDGQGRRIYEALADPYEGIVKRVEMEKLARYVREQEV